MRTPNFDLLYGLEPHERPGPEEADYFRLTVDMTIPKFFATNPQGTSGLVYSWFGGALGDKSIPGGSKALSPNSTNYFEIDNVGNVTSNTSGFTSGKMPLAVVKAGATEIDLRNIEDRRSFVSSGPKGDPGPKGDIGPPPTMDVGQVFTLAPGSNAEVSISPVSGQDGKYAITFKIPRGDKGEPGEDGVDGVSVTIKGTLQNTSSLPSKGTPGDGYLIGGDLYVWQGSKWENVGNIQGPIGDKGDTGPPPELEIGNVDTLEPDEAATVTIEPKSDEPGRYYLNFAIPKGFDGLTPKIDSVGVKMIGPDSEPTAEVVEIETGVFGLNLELPRGEKGEPGDSIKGDPGESIKGDTGPPPEIEVVEVVTLPAGSNATAQFSPGSEPGKYQLVLQIPRGEKGNTGDPGKDGDGSGTVWSVGLESKSASVSVTPNVITDKGVFEITLKGALGAIDAIGETKNKGYLHKTRDGWELLSKTKTREHLQAQKQNPILDELAAITQSGFVYIGQDSKLETRAVPSLNWTNIDDKPQSFEPSKHEHAVEDIVGLLELATEAETTARIVADKAVTPAGLKDYALKEDIPDDYAPSDHVHKDYALKEDIPNDYAPNGHTHNDYALRVDIPTVPEFATEAETTARIVADKAVTPAGLKKYALKTEIPTGGGGGDGDSSFAYAFVCS